MDETIDHTLVFAKTPKGLAEINARSGALTLQARRVLIMIDGRRPVSELMAVVRTGEFDKIMSLLEQQGMIEKVDASLVQRDYDEEDYADTISLLQENAAALRALPGLSSADLAHAARPAASPRAVEGSADASAAAARAAASAGASRPSDSSRRPLTINVPASATRNDMAQGTARPPTINTVTRVPEHAGSIPAAVARPATIHEHAPASVAAAAATVSTAARAEPAQAPAPAAAPASAAPARTLEEEKRFVVSELYSILGPYGEQPAAKLMECATLEALREQVKQAGKRVATFRGEKAAQDYLRSVGYA